jgi:P-type Ca2+ transporter type 2C
MSDGDDAAFIPGAGVVTQQVLDNLSSLQNEVYHAEIENQGGIDAIAAKLNSSAASGLSDKDVEAARHRFGKNVFPESPMESYLDLLLGALNDPTLIVLLVAAIVSLIIGIIQEGPEHGWIEGAAILIAVILVSNIAAMNDYSKQAQFAALEATADDDEKCRVLRNGKEHEINPRDLVVGDIIVMVAGDKIPADALMIDLNVVTTSEAALTGEPEDLKKSKDGKPTLYSSCLISEAGDNFKSLVVGVGVNSQWGKIKATLSTEATDTPLQEKLNKMTAQIGYIGIFFALLTFISLTISIWSRPEGGVDSSDVTSKMISAGIIKALILSFTIVVVAIPEGLPLAVTIALAYSTKEMYKDQCLIRVLAACETMGNATNICSDKTGTLTENRMTVVAGWFCGKFYDNNNDEFAKLSTELNAECKEIITDNTSMNRTAVLMEGPGGLRAVGNKTEGALMLMGQNWQINYEDVRKAKFVEGKDKLFAFNSAKKRSTVVIHNKDGSCRVYVKGASEWVIKDCTQYLDSNGKVQKMDDAKLAELNEYIGNMADKALRTLVLAHVDFPNEAAMGSNWEEQPPDAANLVCDCIVGIQDPLRSDVKDAVKTAQEAGVVVRMVTGDNIRTAQAIAKECGILTEGGIAVEGPNFRKMTLKDADEAIKNLQVMARSSPDDKHLLVTRLNGGAIPKDQFAWEKFFAKYPDMKWETHKDKVLPGYLKEWKASRPNGGEVVGVTGDGTNDAPALKAADVGLSMGITGTEVAKGASDIVILDDRFGSIVKAIMWGRSVFDNIRKFLQFQLTVNVVALLLVFIGAAAGFGQPLTAVQMLWVNLIMDTLGALALGTEKPTPALLQRKPYKRNASLISDPMWRNIAFQSLYQLVLLFVLLFASSKWFDVRDISTDPCFKFELAPDVDVVTTTWKDAAGVSFGCSAFTDLCKDQGSDCIEKNGFDKDIGFVTECLSCADKDYTHGTIIFNAFIWCQIFNEYTARSILNKVNPFEGLMTNFMFIYVSIFSALCQILIVEFGGRFTSTSPLTLEQHLITIGLGLGSIFVGMLMRYYPMEEDPSTFFGTDDVVKEPNWFEKLSDYIDSFFEDDDGELHPHEEEIHHDNGEIEFTKVSTTDIENKI